MIVNHWPPWFRALYGGEWPTTYCAVDCETTGFSVDKDVVTEWGHVLVVDGKVTDRLSLVLDWTGHPVVLDHWLRTRLDSLRQHMALNGHACHMTYERMREEGTKPDKALAFVRDFTDTIKRKGILFVAHNGVFDERMIAANLLGFPPKPGASGDRRDPPTPAQRRDAVTATEAGFSFGDNGWIDTECVEKAGQAADNERMHPWKGDTLRDYWHRVKYTRLKGVRSSLGDHCYTKYDFAGKGVPKDRMHGAETDAFCTHLLMEAYRALIRPGGPAAVYPTADHKAERTGKPIAVPAPRPAAAPKNYRGQRSGW